MTSPFGRPQRGRPPAAAIGGVYEARLVGFEPYDISTYVPGPGVPFPQIYVEAPRLMPGRRYGPMPMPLDLMLIIGLGGEGGAEAFEAIASLVVIYVAPREGRADDLVAIGCGLVTLPFEDGGGEEPPPEEPPPEDPPPDE